MKWSAFCPHLQHFGSPLLEHLLELGECGVDAVTSALRVHVQLPRLLVHVVVRLGRGGSDKKVQNSEIFRQRITSALTQSRAKPPSISPSTHPVEILHALFSFEQKYFRHALDSDGEWNDGVFRDAPSVRG